MRPQPSHRYANGDVYSGELLGLARHGAGECKYGGGASVYQGQWAADRHEGQGRLSSRRGEEFDGEWLAGEPHGQVLTAYYRPLAPALPSRNSSHACTLAPALDPNASLGPNPNPNPNPRPNQGRRRSAERVEEEGAFEGGLLHGQGRRSDALGGAWRGVFVCGVLQVSTPVSQSSA